MLFNAHQCDHGAVSTTMASLNRDVTVVESVARMARTRGLGRATTSHLLLPVFVVIFATYILSRLF